LANGGLDRLNDWCDRPDLAGVKLLLEIGGLVFGDSPGAGFGSLAVLAAVAGVSQPLGAIAAPIELAAAGMVARVPVPNIDGDDWLRAESSHAQKASTAFSTDTI